MMQYFVIVIYIIIYIYNIMNYRVIFSGIIYLQYERGWSYPTCRA
jgi:hypothetical protein